MKRRDCADLSRTGEKQSLTDASEKLPGEMEIVTVLAHIERLHSRTEAVEETREQNSRPQPEALHELHSSRRPRKGFGKEEEKGAGKRS